MPKKTMTAEEKKKAVIERLRKQRKAGVKKATSSVGKKSTQTDRGRSKKSKTTAPKGSAKRAIQDIRKMKARTAAAG